MSIIVKKFGGTSVGSIELIQNIAQKIAAEHKAGESLVLVVSAMAKTTDELVKLAYSISEHPSRRELDMLLTSGERISMALLSLALHEYGFSSISFTGSQSGVMTDARHGNARILSVNAFRIKEELAKGKIVIVAGFQGVSPQKEITTLGRGGSDTSAVALACYLEADRCEIYTDVDGVFTADPRLVEDARFLPGIDYSRMLALSYNGSKVMHSRSIEFARKYNIRVEVKNSRTFAPGTIISSKADFEDKDMEECTPTAIAHKTGLTAYRFADYMAVASLMRGWNIEVFKYYVEDGALELLIENKYDTELKHILSEAGITADSTEPGFGHISVVGLGINLDPQIVTQVWELSAPCEVKRISHSELSIDILLPEKRLGALVQTLHTKLIRGF